MATELSDTRRRAEIRGRESVARWRIESGVWSGRLFAVIYVMIAIVPLLSGERESRSWMAAIATLVLAAAILWATQRMKSGSRGAACFLIALFVAAKLNSWIVMRQPLWAGALWTIILLGGLANGAWGAFALASAKRDALSVPPAPPKQQG